MDTPPPLPPPDEIPVLDDRVILLGDDGKPIKRDGKFVFKQKE